MLFVILRDLVVMSREDWFFSKSPTVLKTSDLDMDCCGSDFRPGREIEGKKYMRRAPVVREKKGLSCMHMHMHVSEILSKISCFGEFDGLMIRGG